MKNRKFPLILSLALLAGSMAACSGGSVPSSSSSAPTSEVSSKPSESVAPASSAKESSAPASSVVPASSEAPVSSIPEKVKKEVSLAITNELNRTYDGNVSTVEYTCDSDGTVEVSWFDGETAIDGAPRNAGTYKVVLTVPETEEYKEGKLEQEFTIAKYAMSIMNDGGYEAGKTVFTVECSYLHDDMIEGDEVTATITTSSDQAGHYNGEDIVSVELSGACADNYTISADDVDFYINRDLVDRPVVTDNTFVYDGTAKSLNIPESEFYTIEGNSATEAGHHEVKVTPDNNHMWSDTHTWAAMTFDLVIVNEYVSTFEMDISEIDVSETDGSNISGTVTKGSAYIGMDVSLYDDVNSSQTHGVITDLKDEDGYSVSVLNENEVGHIVIASITAATEETSVKVVMEKKDISQYTFNAPTVTKAPTASEAGTVTYTANEDPNVKADLAILAISETYYTKALKSEGNCITKEIDTYTLRASIAKSTLTGAINNGLLPSGYNDNTHTAALQSICVFDLEGDYDAASHLGAYTYSWATQPSYTLSTNTKTAGKMNMTCDDCSALVQTDTVDYSSGSWKASTNNTYRHVYSTAEGTTINGETGRSQWNYRLDLNGGTASGIVSTTGSSSVTTLNHTWEIVCSDTSGTAKFTKTGYHISGLQVYVDGDLNTTITTSSTIITSRAYTSVYSNGNYLRFEIRIGDHSATTGCSNYTGDVYAKLVWEAD